MLTTYILVYSVQIATAKESIAGMSSGPIALTTGTSMQASTGSILVSTGDGNMQGAAGDVTIRAGHGTGTLYYAYFNADFKNNISHVIFKRLNVKELSVRKSLWLQATLSIQKVVEEVPYAIGVLFSCCICLFMSGVGGQVSVSAGAGDVGGTVEIIAGLGSTGKSTLFLAQRFLVCTLHISYLQALMGMWSIK